ncbi:hypothetical protein A8L34_22695 [Bacillus sp. FJAT-27264]|uniref:hypothetical protein n=1 Tax=Paenibacillus sp. (strain DSM 101736 / FJAT-27264) TaxID=1850362 RepID=UPI000807A7FE|nr:hypothetical protein [Bacillus sp. FJAT-27264]OBZ08958.1 hypothetical protein A8L34_22695 [Bacillus sp. FJAT-27264]
MDKSWNEWSDTLSEQDIPAEVVDWNAVTTNTPENDVSVDGDKLDAEQTIGEVPPITKQKDKV